MLSHLDLFSGIGGFSLGLESAGLVKTVAFCDYEKFCQKVLKKHWPHVPIYGDVKELTHERLKADGINSIDKRRKSEALWLFSNHSNIVTWLRQNPKKRFTSLSALQKAYNFANKPKQEDTSEEKEILQIEDKSSEQSDVGQSAKEEPKVQKKLTAYDIAFEAVLALDTNGISKEEFLVALKEQLELIEENIQLDEVA